jgi:hypothetical protein
VVLAYLMTRHIRATSGDDAVRVTAAATAADTDKNHPISVVPGMSLEAALALVSEHRAVQLNVGFVDQLAQLEKSRA